MKTRKANKHADMMKVSEHKRRMEEVLRDSIYLHLNAICDLAENKIMDERRGEKWVSRILDKVNEIYEMT